MTKADLVKAITEKNGMSKKDAEAALNSTISCITDALVNGEKVQIVGFGTFEVRQRGEKKCKNPQTGKEMITPAKKAPAFKAGKGLKDAVNK
ncbi:MAG: HU family DNA-binding protein [Ruminococcus sp.]|nr:HU family DNA-binding protein [Ruminococcus sp.]